MKQRERKEMRMLFVLITAILYGFFMIFTPVFLISVWFSKTPVLVISSLVSICLSFLFLSNGTFRRFYVKIKRFSRRQTSTFVTIVHGFLMLVLESGIIFSCQKEDYMIIMFGIASICVFIISVFKLVCGKKDKTGISHKIFELFLHISVQNLLHGYWVGLGVCGLVSFIARINEITPDLTRITFSIPTQVANTVQEEEEELSMV